MRRGEPQLSDTAARLVQDIIDKAKSEAAAQLNTQVRVEGRVQGVDAIRSNPDLQLLWAICCKIERRLTFSSLKNVFQDLMRLAERSE